MNDDLLQLLTAATDGELSPDEARRLKRVLAASEEARALYAKLKADATRLRALPPVQPPDDLHKRIMARIAETTPPPVRRPSQPTPRQTEPAAAPSGPTERRTFRPWVAVAVAAAVLVCVTTSSFLFFADQNQAAKGKGTRHGESESAKWLPAENTPRPSEPVAKDRPIVPDRKNVAVGPAPRPVPPVVPPDVVVIAPEPRVMRADLIAFPPIPETRFDLVQVRVPFLKALAEFDRDDVRQQLAEELALDPAFRIELFTRDPNRGVAAFRAAAKSAGLAVFADAAALERLRKHPGGAVVYTESLTAGEIADLVEKLALEDARHSPRLFDHLHALPATAADSEDLRTILGVDLGLFKRIQAGDRNPRGVDPTKPISAGTADQIVKSIAGQGGTAEKSAVLLNWNSASSHQTKQTNSAELKQYLAKRGKRPADAVPVLIVIRPGNG